MSFGTLYMIASPIGNLEDITIRALRILREGIDAVYCEDTRQTRKLLDHYGIRIPIYSLHAHSPQKRVDELVDLLTSGKSAAYITDSGTPGISDPGNRAVWSARAKGVQVIPVPGASALSSLLSVSGFPETNVFFTGFLSKKDARRRKELLKARENPGIIVLFESPYRVKKTLLAIGDVFPSYDVLIGREMTKFHEEYISGSIEEIVKAMDSLTEKGEFTIAIHNRKKKRGSDD